MASENNMMQFLKQNAYGTNAIAIQKRFSIVLDFSLSSGPAQFDGANTVSINRSLPDQLAASYYVHEMYHVLRNKTKQSVPETSDDQEAYVSNAVQEEVDGTILQFFFFLSLDFAGLLTSLSEKTTPPNYIDFRSNCRIFFDKALASTGDKQKAIETERIKASNLINMWITSKDNMRLGTGADSRFPFSYRESYTGKWKAAHRNRAP